MGSQLGEEFPKRLRRKKKQETTRKNKWKTSWPPLFPRSEATSESILLANTHFQASQLGEEFPKKLRRTKKSRKNKWKTSWPPLFSRSEATSESILLANTHFQASQFGEEFPKKLRRTKKTSGKQAGHHYFSGRRRPRSHFSWRTHISSFPAR